MKITIKDKTIELKSKMRAYLIYEKITDSTFNPQTITDLTIYLYSLLIANDLTLQLTFDEFIEYLDENPNVFEEFNNWLINEANMSNQFTEVKKKTVN